MPSTVKKRYLYLIGLIPVIWFSLLVAPFFDGGLPKIIKDFPKAMENPFLITWCNDSIKVILLFLFIYLLGIIIYLSTEKNYRRRSEYGSAKWGNVGKLNKG